MNYTFLDIIVCCILSHIVFYIFVLFCRKTQQIITKYYELANRAYNRAIRIIDKVECALTCIEPIEKNIDNAQASLNHLSNSIDSIKMILYCQYFLSLFKDLIKCFLGTELYKKPECNNTFDYIDKSMYQSPITVPQKIIRRMPNIQPVRRTHSIMHATTTLKNPCMCHNHNPDRHNYNHAPIQHDDCPRLFNRHSNELFSVQNVQTYGVPIAKKAIEIYQQQKSNYLNANDILSVQNAQTYGVPMALTALEIYQRQQNNRLLDQDQMNSNSQVHELIKKQLNAEQNIAGNNALISALRTEGLIDHRDRKIVHQSETQKQPEQSHIILTKKSDNVMKFDQNDENIETLNSQLKNAFSRIINMKTTDSKTNTGVDSEETTSDSEDFETSNTNQNNDNIMSQTTIPNVKVGADEEKDAMIRLINSAFPKNML